jgi:hypothetical protein
VSKGVEMQLLSLVPRFHESPGTSARIHPVSCLLAVIPEEVAPALSLIIEGRIWDTRAAGSWANGRGDLRTGKSDFGGGTFGTGGGRSGTRDTPALNGSPQSLASSPSLLNAVQRREVAPRRQLAR